jgi:chromate transporter
VVAAMKADGDVLATLAVQLAVLSLLAIGGANAIVPELHRQTVEIAGWLTEQQFVELFAIAQAMPGPNFILVTLIGYHVAGVAGAMTATAAMCGPTCLLAYFVGKGWERFRNAPWRIAIQAGLVPVSIGLLCASAIVLARIADHNWVALAITVATVAITYFGRLNPLWMFAVGGLCGLAGLV